MEWVESISNQPSSQIRGNMKAIRYIITLINQINKPICDYATELHFREMAKHINRRDKYDS